MKRAHTTPSRNPLHTLAPQVEGQDESYDLLNLLDFSSDRKRMTVVVRFPDGKIRALMKGADTMVLARIVPVCTQRAGLAPVWIIFTVASGLSLAHDFRQRVLPLAKRVGKRKGTHHQYS